jgi:ATP-dependent Lhr-like helicase
MEGKIESLSVDTPVPSVLSHELLNANPYAYLDDTPLEERRARAVEMRRVLPDSVLQEVGRLDPQVIQDIQTQIWPDVRNADELHDFLLTVIALPIAQAMPWESYFQELLTLGRAGIASYKNKEFLLTTEKLKTFSVIYPEAIIKNNLKE